VTRCCLNSDSHQWSLMGYRYCSVSYFFTRHQKREASQGTEVSRSSTHEPSTPSFPRQSPADIIHVPQVDQENKRQSCKRGTTEIITSWPYRNELIAAEERLKAKKNRKYLYLRRKQLKVEEEWRDLQSLQTFQRQRRRMTAMMKSRAFTVSQKS